MTEAMPFLQNYDITFLRPPPIGTELFYREKSVGAVLLAFGQEVRHALEADGECGHVVQLSLIHI